jgi:iron complex outermembrane recepter protein
MTNASRLMATPLSRAMALAFGAWGLVGAGAVLAQATPASPTGAPAADSGQLTTITVTATRRIEDQQKVSTSVTALSAEKLAERNIYDISQFEGLSPGFTFGRSGSDARPAMRGVRTEAVQQNADTTIGFFIDGIYKSRPSQALASFVDLERVEVQRGPQGTLFGRNTFGGNIVLSTARPELGETSAEGSLLLGSFKRVRVEAVGNIPVASTVAIRLAAAVDKSDGYVKNDFNSAADLFDQDLRYFRASVRFKPDNRFDAFLKFDSTEQRGNGAGGFSYFQKGTYLNGTCRPLLNSTFYTLNGRGGLTDGVADCTRTVGIPGGAGVGTTADVGRPIYSAGDPWRVENDYQSELKLSDKSFTADVSYRFDNFTLKSITGVSDFSVLRTVDQDFSREAIVISHERTKNKSLSQELQVLSEGSGPFGYVAGVYFFKDKTDNLAVFQTVRRSTGNGFFDTAVSETESTAAYAQLSFAATSDLKLTAGMRYTVDKKKYKFANRNHSGIPVNPDATQPDPVFTSLDSLVASDAAFGSAGVTNCGPAVGGFPAGTVALGANCGGVGNNTFFGATYTPVEFKKNTGRLAAEYSLSKSQLLYISYSTGFSSGGFNGSQTALITEATRTFNPQEVTAVEIGSKNRFLNNTLQFNVAAFMNRYKDQQEQRQVPVGLTTASLLFNAAKAEAKGVELESEWRVTRNFTLGATLSLLDAKYTSFPDAPGPIAITQLIDSPGTAATVVNGVTIAPAGQTRVYAPGYNCGLVSGTGVGVIPQAFGCDLTGKKIPYAADRSGSVSAAYTIGLGGLGSITPMVVVNFSSGYFGQIYNVEAEKQGAYTKTDLKLNWKVNDALNVQAFVDNATNTLVVNRFVWGGGSTMQNSAAAPRTFGVKLGYKFL